MTDNQHEEGATQTESVKKSETVHTSVSMDQNKIFAILGYIIPFLFFIPLVTEGKNNAYARFHANQQLNLLLLDVLIKAVLIGLGMTLILLPISALLAPITAILVLVLVIMGVINAANGVMKPLPIIGKYKLIK